TPSSKVYDLMAYTQDEGLQQQEMAAATAEANAARALADVEKVTRELRQRLDTLLREVQRTATGGRSDPPFLRLVEVSKGIELRAPNTQDLFREARQAREHAAQVRARCAEALRERAMAVDSELAQASARLDLAESAFAALPPAPQKPAPTPARAPSQASPEPRPDERRRQPRVQLQAVVGYHSEDNFYTGFSSDISEGGLFVSTINVLPAGSRVQLAFSLPGGYRAE